MKTTKRIKHIVALTVDDFYNSKKSTNEIKSDTKKWIYKALLTYEGLEDYTTIEISLQVLKLLNSFDIVDLEYIHNLLFADVESSETNMTFSFVFDEVQL